MDASESIFYISNHRGLAIGNGLVFYFIHLLPVIGWVLAPAYAVIAAAFSLYEIKKPATEKVNDNKINL
jgi:CysZ protein